MKKMNYKAPAILCATVYLMTSAALTVNAENTAKGSEIKANIRICVNDAWLYCNEDAGIWYDSMGNILTDRTERRQTALYEGETYTVDLDQMQVIADDGSVNEELSAVLPVYLAYRPLSFCGLDGVYFDELYGTDEYDSTVNRAQKLADSLPLTYTFSGTTDPFVCYISMPNEETYFAGMQYSFDANDYPEAIPFCDAEALMAETGNYTLPEASEPEESIKDKPISKVHFGDTWYYCNESTGIWYNREGNLLTDMTAHQQTALYKGTLYTVDLDQMQVIAVDGTVNEELSALLPVYLGYRPVSVYEMNGVALEELFGTEEYDAAAEYAKKIADSLPLTYKFSESTDPFVCYISMPDEETYFAGMQYSVDANDTPEAVQFCNSELIGMSVESDYLNIGDADLNSEVNVLDAVMAARVIAEDTTVPISQLGLELMDMNGDCRWTPTDLTTLLKYLAHNNECKIICSASSHPVSKMV